MSTTIPSARPASTPRDFFLHLLAIFTLYVSVVSVMTLLFQFINELLPDVLTYYREGILGSIRWSTASIVIMFPVYLFVSWLIQRDVIQEPEKAHLRVRRWLVHFTLFIAALTIIIDLVTLVYEFLSGELSMRFVLKVLVVLMTTSTVFGYYFWDLRRMEFSFSSLQKSVVAAVSGALLAAVIGGFFIVGSPAYQRSQRLDLQRVSDLQSIQNEMMQYWQNKRVLPTSLGSLDNSINGFMVPVDPENGTSYEYVMKSDLSFELCAVFATETPKVLQSDGVRKTIPIVPNDPYSQNWNHGVGRTCFARTIDPQLYPKPLK